MHTAIDNQVKNSLLERFLAVRAYSEALAQPLSAEDQCVQSMPDVSPTKWHLAHTSWFFETFILCGFSSDYEVLDPDFSYLFNSYYQNVGPQYSRPQRGLITRPSVMEVLDYRKYVNEGLVNLMKDLESVKSPEEVLTLLELGINHEQQHQELILSDIKNVLYANSKLPIYLENFPVRQSNFEAYAKGHKTEWQKFNPPTDDGKRFQAGYAGEGFCFDNELQVHDVLLEDFELSSGLVTAGDWLEFIADGGYDTPTLWLSDGWHHIQATGCKAPEYVFQIDGQWKVFTLSGVQDLNPQSPVMHISYYEADAFARWAGARLPTEFEWEYATVNTSRELPSPVWEWTASPYSPYPGFTPAEGAVGEYNGKFMVNQMVSRGGCWATPDGHIRPTYRNFYPPQTRWHFSGLRLARDI